MNLILIFIREKNKVGGLKRIPCEKGQYFWLYVGLDESWILLFL